MDQDLSKSTEVVAFTTNALSPLMRNTIGGSELAEIECNFLLEWKRHMRHEIKKKTVESVKVVRTCKRKFAFKGTDLSSSFPSKINRNTTSSSQDICVSTDYSAASPKIMKLLSRNCRGIGDP